MLSLLFGPAGNTLILSLLFGSGREHCDLALAVRLVACCSGPAGNTLILSLLSGPGREHCDLALGVEFRVGTL